MSIPSGTKFHGVAPGVDTENRGSANANADRDTYAIEEFNGTSFKGWIFGPPEGGTIYLYDLVIYQMDTSAFAPANPTNFPTLVSQGSAPNNFFRGNAITPVGIVKRGSQKGKVVDVVVQGIQSPAYVLYETGITPEVGDNLYGSGRGFITGTPHNLSASSGGQKWYGDYFALGTVTGTNPVEIPELTPLYGATLWEVGAYYSFPAQSQYYVDGIDFNSSVRRAVSSRYSSSYPEDEVGRPGEIVKIKDVYVASTTHILVERVSSSDPVESFFGIVPDSRKSPGSLPTDNLLNTDMVCMRGNLFLPRWVINGPTPTLGGLIYADATTPYKLTTDSTSGTVVGLVQHLTNERVLIQVKL